MKHYSRAQIMAADREALRRNEHYSSRPKKLYGLRASISAILKRKTYRRKSYGPARIKK